MQTVHVRVVDAETLKPVAVRLRVTDAAGRSCVPWGRPAIFRTGSGEDVGGQVRLDGENWYYLDGGAEIPVPPGPVRVQAWHGPEYLPLDETVEVKPGQMALRFRLQRWSDERAQGWYSGDIGGAEIDPFAALLEAQAEDLAVVQLAVREQDVGEGAVRLANLLAFSGAEPALGDVNHLVGVGTHNQHPDLGELRLLGCHRPVYPLRFVGLTWSLIDWCDQAHRKKDGLVVFGAEPCSQRGEMIAASLAGKIDAVDVRGWRAGDWQQCYALWNAGARLAIVAGSRKDSNAVALGEARTYAQLAVGETLTCAGWLAAIRAGRTYATTGPLLSLLVGGQGPGGRATSTVGTAVSVWAEARAKVPFTSLEMVRAGEVVATLEPRGELFRGQLVSEFVAESSGWMALRCRRGAEVIAHSSPVWIEVAGQPAAAESELLQRELQGTRVWAQTAPGEEKFRRQLLDHLAAAEQRLSG